MRTEEPFHYGVVGSGDIWGIMIGGYHIWFECKTGNAVQSQQQKNFEANVIKKFGGYYFVVKSAEEALDSLLRAVSDVATRGGRSDPS